MSETIQILDVVALTKDLPEKELRKGQVGTVVESLGRQAREPQAPPSAVDLGVKRLVRNRDRVEHLFARYEQLASPMIAPTAPPLTGGPTSWT
jgi:hypothetical protein